MNTPAQIFEQYHRTTAEVRGLYLTHIRESVKEHFPVGAKVKAKLYSGQEPSDAEVTGHLNNEPEQISIRVFLGGNRVSGHIVHFSKLEVVE